GEASSEGRERPRAPCRRLGPAQGRSSNCRRRSQARADGSSDRLLRLELRQMFASGSQKLLGQALGLRRLADERAREQRLVAELALAGNRRPRREPLVGRDVLDEAEELGREWRLRQRLGTTGADPG